MRLAVVAFLATPAYAATLAPITIEECAGISTKDMRVDAVEPRCAAAHLPENPYTLADSDWHKTPPALKAGFELPVPQPTTVAAVSHPVSSGFARATGGALAAIHSPASAPPLYITHREPWRPEPSPVPIPASLPLYAALMACVGLLWRRGW